MNLFARGNTNDGGGFDIRLYHFVAGATFGYPSLFRNFTDEVIPPLADYGTGSGTGMLYVAGSRRCRRRTATRCIRSIGARNAIYRHPLTPKGATFTVGQEPFVTVAAADRHGGRRPLAAVRGELARRTVPLRRREDRLSRPADAPAARRRRRAPDRRRPPPMRDSWSSSSPTTRCISRFAQQALLRRGRSAERISLLERGSPARGFGRRPVAAIFTLKQLGGADAHAGAREGGW